MSLGLMPAAWILTRTLFGGRVGRGMVERVRFGVGLLSVVVRRRACMAGWLMRESWLWL